MQEVKVRLLNNGNFSGMDKFDYDSVLTAEHEDGNAGVLIEIDEIVKNGGFPQVEIAFFVIGKECEIIQE